MNYRNVFILISVLILCLFSMGCGDDGSTAILNPTASPNPTPSSVTSLVSGTVYGTDGVPFQGATVTLTPITSSESYGEVQTTTTDSQGRFSFTVSFAGTYIIEAKNGTVLLGSQQFTVTPGVNVSLLLGNATGKLTVGVTPSNAVSSVTVTQIESAAVTELPASQSGEFIFYLPSGTYSITVSATGYNSITRPGITLSEGEEKTETFDLTGEETPIGVVDITPRVVLNSGDLSNISMTISGTDFTGTATVSLTPVTGGTAIEASDVTVVPTDTITCNFNLTGASSGEYTLLINHTPLTTSDTSVQKTFWLTDTIQGAIDRASVIYGEESPSQPVNAFIPAGVYQAGTSPALPTLPLLLKSGVYIEGAGITGTVTEINDLGGVSGNPYIFIAPVLAENCIVEGFKFDGTNLETGIYLEVASKNCIIRNNSFSGFTASIDAAGIYFAHSQLESSVVITGNTLNNNTRGIFALGQGIMGTISIDITENTLNNNGIGIEVQGSYKFHSNITGNEITGTTADAALYVAVQQIENLNISGNRITGNQADSLRIQSSLSNVSIKNNEISGNTSPGGMLVQNQYSTIDISGNKITGNTTSGGGSGAVVLINNSTVTIIGNEISGNTCTGGLPGGLVIAGQADGDDFVNRNNIYGNTGDGTGQQLYYAGTTTLNAQNNWWGHTVPPALTNAEVFDLVTPTVDVSNPAGSAFPGPFGP